MRPAICAGMIVLWWIAAGLVRAEVGAVDLANQRLELMRAVAVHKWLNGLPIEAREREAAVLQRSEQAALRHGIEIDATRALFGAQIAAAKQVQAYWFERWKTDDPPAAAQDLNTEIRPRLLDIGEQILAAVATSGCCAADAAEHLVVEGLSGASRASLVRALASIRRYGSRLDQVLRSGVLRIGTTGDYAPFSHRAPGQGSFVGIDIDLAHDLAESLHAEPRFVATSWPTLMDDLGAGNFDIAMSGITRTLQRQRRGYFTPAYHVGGKTPIARCEDRARFATLEQIDRETVRVIVNPGGTNERFVDARINRAQKLVHQDNRSIFIQLVEGAADVMITDRIEVMHQSKIHKEVLCPTMAENLTYHEKAYLLPRDDDWLAYVTQWLKLKQTNAEVQAIFARHLGDN